MTFFGRFFGGKTNGSIVVPPYVVGKKVGHSRSANRKALEAHDVQAIIPQGLEINGDITTTRGAVIDGFVRGNITVANEGAAILIRGTAVLFGNIRGGKVLVSGEVNGIIEADYVRLYAGARFYGQVKARRLVVDDGATILSETFGVMDVLHSEKNNNDQVQRKYTARTVLVDLLNRDKCQHLEAQE
jgi:cytoskeletal protein CcmA (bactofilin family)